MKNTIFFISGPILTYDSSFFSAQGGEQLSLQANTLKPIFNPLTGGGGHVPNESIFLENMIPSFAARYLKKQT